MSIFHRRSQQRTDQRVLILTWKFFPRKKHFQVFFYFFLPFYTTFQCGRYNVFKKILNLFFVHENIKKRPQKLLIICPKLFFHKYDPELIFHIINMFQDSSVSLSVVFLFLSPSNQIYLVMFVCLTVDTSFIFTRKIKRCKMFFRYL